MKKTYVLLLICIVLIAWQRQSYAQNIKSEIPRIKYNNPGLETDLAVGLWSSPLPMDFDNDGDLDLICGEFVDRFTWFENTGTREKPVFAKGRFLKNNKNLITMDLEMMRTAAVDWNQDGNIDLLSGDEDGRIAFIENTGKIVDNMPVFKPVVYLKQEADFVKFGALVTPYSVDWDDDGDEDIICGCSAGYIGFIENLGGGDTPVWNKPVRLKADDQIIRIMGEYWPVIRDYKF